MLVRPTRRAPLGCLWQPAAGWLLLAVLYLTAAVLSVLLALAARSWWPHLLSGALMAAGAACVLVALDRRN